MTSYETRHARVRKARGKASDYQCECGAQAIDWACDHDKDGENPYDYRPLCRNCHVNYDRPGKGVVFPKEAFTHGTQYAYRIHGCRCQECRDWKAEEARIYRQNRIAKGWQLRRGKWVTVPGLQSQS